MSDVLSGLRDKAANLPSVDLNAVKDHLPSQQKSHGRLRVLAMIASALAIATAVAGYLRNRQAL
jgi:hypothetical protein